MVTAKLTSISDFLGDREGVATRGEQINYFDKSLEPVKQSLGQN